MLSFDQTSNQVPRAVIKDLTAFVHHVKRVIASLGIEDV